MSKRKIEIKCIMCHKTHVIEVDTMGYDLWNLGMQIQFALPKLSADDRELLISKICPDCFNKACPDE